MFFPPGDRPPKPEDLPEGEMTEDHIIRYAEWAKKLTDPEDVKSASKQLVRMTRAFYGMD